MRSELKTIWLLIVSYLLLAPFISYAAPTDFKSLVNIFIQVLKLVISLVYMLSILAFFWGIAKYIFSAGSEDQKKEAKNVMTWGLVAIFMLTSFYGILKLFGGSFLPKWEQYRGPQPTKNQETYRQMDDGSFREIINPDTGRPYVGVESI